MLVVITDQQRADHVGFAGNPDLRTPNLDALAARSTVFDRAYVANPVCSPNRSSIWLTAARPPRVALAAFWDPEKVMIRTRRSVGS